MKTSRLLPLLCSILLIVVSAATVLTAQEGAEPVPAETEATTTEAQPLAEEGDGDLTPVVEPPAAEPAGETEAETSPAKAKSSKDALIGVAAVVLVIWIGLFAWVWRIDRQVKDLYEI